jgi:tetratricopeptide (TPR) repeat protein
MIALLRLGGSRGDLAKALIALALAQRAVGDTAGASVAAGEAEGIEPLDAALRQQLVSLGILAEEAPAPAPKEATDDTEVVVKVEAAPPARPAATKEATERRAPEAEAAPPAAAGAAPKGRRSRGSGDDDAVLIDFDSVEEESPAASAEAEPPTKPAAAAAPAKPAETAAPTTPASTVSPAAAAAAKPGGKRVRAPGADMIEEIRLLVQGGLVDEAGRRIETLRALGYASSELDDLEAAIDAPQAAEPVSANVAAPANEPPATPEADPDEESLASMIADVDDSDDLSAITAALESEIFADEVDEAPVPEADSEQSLEDVFAAFKQHVQEEVGSEDYRTHYDLGIAYKEMGLMDEAIGEFVTAVKAPEMQRDAAIMLAICHRGQGQVEQAAAWYGKAIAAPGGDAESISALRYELAEMLLDSGDSDGALKVFRDVLAEDPTFRDVAARIEQLESTSTST